MPDTCTACTPFETCLAHSPRYTHSSERGERGFADFLMLAFSALMVFGLMASCLVR